DGVADGIGIGRACQGRATGLRGWANLRGWATFAGGRPSGGASLCFEEACDAFFSGRTPFAGTGYLLSTLEVHMKRALFGFAALALMTTPAAAQTVRLDEGTFRILVSGREVGTE